MIARWLPGIALFRDYPRDALHGDLVAGLSAFLVMIPSVLAYSELVGVPPAYGLYAAIGAMAGYLNGSALILVGTQLGKLLGVRVQSDAFFLRVWEALLALPATHLPTLVLGLSLIGLLYLLKRFAPAVPGSLAVCILGIVVAYGGRTQMAQWVATALLLFVLVLARLLKCSTSCSTSWAKRASTSASRTPTAHCASS